MKKTAMRKYARLVAEVGGAVKKGQEVNIVAGLDQPEFVTMLAEECYRLGASRVKVEWSHLPLAKLAVRHQKLSVLSEVTSEEEAKWHRRAKDLPVMIYVESDDPDGLNGINQEKNAKAIRARQKVIRPIRDTMENKYQWCIAAVPGKAWARKVFPDLRPAAAVEKLWEVILRTARADGANPVADWKEHNRDLDERCAYLNGLGIRELRYHAGNGTDFRVGLLPDGIFAGGNERTLSGNVFNPNMPTEEVFTSPRRGDADGIVFASKPLSYNGGLIENFSIRFEKGKAVEVHAEKGEDLLREMIAMDEGAAYLGECALVPVNSPISESGILFWNTLFDENAACHLALGRGFNECVRNFEKYTMEEIREHGINSSMIHVDFMIGTPDMEIDAVCEDGRIVPIFRSGTWAF